MILMNKLLKSPQVLFLVSGVIILVYILPYLISGKDAHLLIHDNLDSNFVYYKVLIDTHTLFSPNSTIIESFMGGIPRSSLPGEFDFFVLWFRLFGPLGAYIFNRIIVILIAFCGMYFLLKKHIIPGESNLFAQTSIALVFSLLPFWPPGGLTVAGIPLVMYAFLNLRNNDLKWSNWLILGLFPFYSSLVLSGFFLLFTFMLLWIWDLIARKRNIFFPAGLLLISAVYILTNYRLFFEFMLDDSFISHRVEFEKGGLDLFSSLKLALNMLFFGQYHAYSLHTWILLPTVLLAAILLCFNKYEGIRKTFFIVLAFIISTSLLYGFLEFAAFQPLMQVIYNFFPMQLGRFHFLHPVLWMLLFALSLSVISQKFRQGKMLVQLLIGFQLIYSFSFHELFKNRNTPTFNQFYAQNQFSEIDKFIGQPQKTYRVASLGIHPGISQFNGFYTIDGYVANYPVAYKHRFREVIKGELAKNEALRKYYDYWGSRVYLFSDELDKHGNRYMNAAGNTIEIQKLALGYESLKSLGCSFLLSSVKINESKNPELRFERAFTDKNSAWDIYLYKVNR